MGVPAAVSRQRGGSQKGPRRSQQGPRQVPGVSVLGWSQGSLATLDSLDFLFCGAARSGTSVEASSAHVNGQRRSRQFRVEGLGLGFRV